MSQRIRDCFSQLAEQQRQALIPFVTAGDPHPELTVDILHQLVESGADVIELGVPFTDPMADGPVIQAADERALAHGITTLDVFDLVRAFRQNNQHTPIVLMGYLNPIEIMGYSSFASQAAEAGVDGLIVVDLPPEESGELKPALDAQQIDLIFLIAPTTNDQRIELINKAASGYLYYVSLKGVTGANTIDLDSVQQKLAQIRQYSDLPIGVGFGIKDGATAGAVSQLADAVVVGSALVQRIADHQNDKTAMLQSVAELIAEMRAAMDQK